MLLKRKTWEIERYCTVDSTEAQIGQSASGCPIRDARGWLTVVAAREQEMITPERQLAIYSRRFAGIEKRRTEVWRILARHYFNRWVRPADSVVDLGAGYCEFINSIQAAHKIALDTNPVTAAKAIPGVKVLQQDATKEWPIPPESADVIFSSNFFEHLPAKEDLARCLANAYQALRPQGLLIVLGPNIRFCYDEYWDFFDHYLPLSDRSMVEAMEITGFQQELVLPRFLPLTMSGRLPHWGFLVRLYLSFSLAQRLWGKQFLVIARRPSR